ncbi:MAG: M20/M25/M40 family metallo-hydrolase [Firmicutes bacterium]|nr:M20/M25/M40 family metallo-hydrolase [Bacillota bacterium]
MNPENVLSELIKINTTNPPGNETAAAHFLAGLLKEAGIACEIVEPVKGRGSLIARFGRGPKKLLYMSHLDVVPAGDGWDFGPFSGEIREGMVLGRGAIDCKDLAAAGVCALLQLAKEGASLKGELIIAATADEEQGGGHGAGHIAVHCPDKIRADFAINEGAPFPLSVNGKMIYFIQVGEKGTAWSRITARGISCHGSIPSLGENAVVKMARAVSALAEYRPGVILIPELTALLAELAQVRELDMIPTPQNVDELLSELDIDTTFTEMIRAMTRMTVSPNMIQGGTKTNIVPDFCECDVDVRILPGQSAEYVMQEIFDLVGPGLEIALTEYREPTFTSSELAPYRLMKQLTEEMAGPEAVCLPVISTGATDSKYLRDLGIPAYGIGHMDPGYDPSLSATMHGRNERIDVKSLRFKTEFLTELARRYLT